MDKKEQKQYLKVFEDLKAAIVRDYPEYVPNIYIIDPSKPFADEMKRAAEYLGIPDLQARVDRQLAAQSSQAYAGMQLGLRRGDVNNTDPVYDFFKTPEKAFYAPDEIPGINDDVSIIFPTYPGQSLRNVDDSLEYALSTLLHEVAHGIHSLNPNYKQTIPLTDGKVHYQTWRQRTETFAETFAIELAANSGLLSDATINKGLISRDKRIYSPMSMQYNANEEVALLRANGSMWRPATYTGFPDLREVYDRSMKAQEANLDYQTMIDLYTLNSALPKFMSFAMSIDINDLEEFPNEKKALENLLSAMPYGQRILGAQNAATNAVYTPLPIDRPDMLKASAKVWLANEQGDRSEKEDFIYDVEAQQFLAAALKQYNAQQAINSGPKIDMNAMQPVIDHAENKVWAEELLKGTPIIEALQRGLASIESAEAAPAQPAVGTKSLQR